VKRLLFAVLLAVGLLAVDATGTNAQEATRTIPVSVTSDCSKNVTSAVAGFVGGGGRMQLLPGGCYQVNAKLAIANGSLDMRGSTFRKTKQESDVEKECGKHAGFIKLGSGGSISNGRLERVGGPGGYDPCHYAEHGIEVVGATNTAASKMTMSRIRGDCLYLQKMQGFLGRDLDCESNGRQGGAISAGRDIKIDGYIVRNSARSGWDFEANGSDADDGIYNFEMSHFDMTTGLIAFPSQGYNAPQDGIYLHDGIIRQSLSAIYDRQVRPSQDNCRGSVQRKNWRVEDVQVFPAVSGAGYGGKGLAVFCGTVNVTVRRLTMPGGEVVMEGSSGTLLVADSCVRGVRAIAPTTAAQVQQVNVKAPPCSGTPPSSTTTRPPTTTSTTRPPVTTQPPEVLTPEQQFIQKLAVDVRAFCRDRTWC
jgi:hypothetical protein